MLRGAVADIEGRVSEKQVPENPGDDAVRLRHRLTADTLQVNGTYHFFDGALTVPARRHQPPVD